MANRKKKNVVLLGVEITIPANAEMSVNKARHSTDWYVDNVELIIGIGKDHTASLIMDVESHEALMRGEKLYINEGAPVE